MGGEAQATLSPSWVYKLYSEDGRLLYIGLSRDPERRLQAHRGGRFGAEIARMDVGEPITNRTEALRAEEQAIRTECPPYNMQYTPEWKRIQIERARARSKAQRIERFGPAMDMDPGEEYFSLGGASRLPECTVSRQGLYWKLDHGTLPDPEGLADGKPVWRRATLEEAGILERPSRPREVSIQNT